MQRTKKPWGLYARALGAAHNKASSHLSASLPLLQHLDELRKRLFTAFVAVLGTTVFSFLFTDRLISFLAGPLGGKIALVSIEVTENMAIYMKVALLSGIILGLPAVVYELVAFIMPGLENKESIWLRVGIPLASVFFIAGVAFTWFVLLPASVPFLVNFMGIRTQVRPLNYFGFITNLMFWIGLFFEMPLVAFLLAKIGFISAGQLARGWRYAVVVIAVIAAAVTPTPDPMNMGLVMLPLIVLYLISIILAAVARRK